MVKTFVNRTNSKILADISLSKILKNQNKTVVLFYVKTWLTLKWLISLKQKKNKYTFKITHKTPFFLTLIRKIRLHMHICSSIYQEIFYTCIPVELYTWISAKLCTWISAKLYTCIPTKSLHMYSWDLSKV